MNFCQRCRALLGEFLDGTLSRPLRENVAAHLETCADCAREKRAVEATRAALNGLKPVPAPPELRLRVRAALQNEAAERANANAKPEWGAGFHFLRPQKFAWAGTLALSAVLLLVLARPFATTPLVFRDQAPTPSNESEDSAAPSASQSAAPTAKPKSQNHLSALKTATPQAKTTVKPKITLQPPAQGGLKNSSISTATKPTAPAFKTPHGNVEATVPGTPLQKAPGEALDSNRMVPAAPAPSRPIVHSRTEPAPLTPAAKVMSPAPALPPTPKEPNAAISRSTVNVMPTAGPRVQFMRQTGFSVEIEAATPKLKMARAFAKTASPKIEQPAADATTMAAPVAQPAPMQATIPAPMPAPRNDAAAGAAPGAQGAFGANDAAPAFRFRGGTVDAPAATQNGGAGGGFGGGPSVGRATVNGALHDQTLDRTTNEGAQSSTTLAAPMNSAARKPDFDILTSNLPRTFSLRVKSPQNVKGAQIRVQLPSALHFPSPDLGSSRVLWTGDFEANKPVTVDLAIAGSGMGSSEPGKITIFLEQKEPGSQSKLLETQTLTLP